MISGQLNGGMNQQWQLILSRERKLWDNQRV